MLVKHFRCSYHDDVLDLVEGELPSAGSLESEVMRCGGSVGGCVAVAAGC